MTLDLIRLLIDTGFLILIWAVQLVIYPSFKFYSSENLYTWHRLYTVRVTFIVLPLMFSQLICALLHIWKIQNWYTLISLTLILLLWLLTFLVFVPLHQSIDNNNPVSEVCHKLVTKNWIRTLLWSVLFFISLMNYLAV